MYKLFIGFFLVCFSTDAFSCDLQTVKSRIGQPFISAQFNQLKHIKVLSRPLKSAGSMLFSQEKGLVWQVQKPIKSTSVLNNSEIKQFNSKDQLMPAQQASQNNKTADLSVIFLNLVSGNFAALEPHFTVTIACVDNTSNWQLKLTPKTKPLSTFFAEITLSGSSHINSMQILEVNQDRTEITFIDHSFNSIESPLFLNLSAYFER